MRKGPFEFLRLGDLKCSEKRCTDSYVMSFFFEKSPASPAMGGDASYVARWYLKMGIFLRIDKLSEY